MENTNNEDLKILEVIKAEETTPPPTQPTETTKETTTETTTQVEEKKKGRGRPKGTKKETENKIHPEKTETEPKADKGTFNVNEYVEADEIKNLQNEHNTKVAPPIQATAPIIQMKPLISGYLLLVCINTVMPNIIIYIFGMFNAKVKKVNPKDIKLDHQERKDLEPIADEVAKIVFAEMNPMSSFLLSLSFMYGGKLLNALDKDTSIKK